MRHLRPAEAQPLSREPQAGAGANMTEEVWLRYAAPRQMLAFLEGKVSDRKVCLAVVACYYRVWEVIDRTPSRKKLVEIVTALEQFADGHLSFEQLRATHERLYTNRYPPPHRWPPRTAIRWVVSAEALAADRIEERMGQTALLKDVFGNPFRPVTFDPSWRTTTAVQLAGQMYEAREFAAMPILADALQDAGCEDAGVLGHCRDPQQVHVRGCWVVDLVLGKA